jgi:hypothetical protein
MIDDVSNLSPGHMEGVRQLLVSRIPFGVNATDFLYLSLCQLCRVMLFAVNITMSMASFVKGIFVIVSNSAKEEMGWIYTSWVIATI